MTLCIRRCLSYALTLTALAGSACDDIDSPEPASVELRGNPGGNPPLNTSKLLDTEIGAVDTTGLPLHGVKLVSVHVKKGITLVPVRLASLRAEFGELVGEINWLNSTMVVSGEDFTDSVWNFRLGSGPFYIYHDAHLTSVETAAEAGLSGGGLIPDPIIYPRKLDPDRLLYTFQDKQPPNPIALCDSDANGGARMLILGDILVDPDNGDIVERENTLQFGCLSSAVGKAALWGYAPDNPTDFSVTLEEFELGERMVRADYCADGVSHTVVGQVISMRDRWGINDFFPSHSTEAAWKAGEGATCVRRERTSDKQLLAPFQCDGFTIPLCPTDAMLGTRLLAADDDIWTKSL